MMFTVSLHYGLVITQKIANVREINIKLKTVLEVKNNKDGY